jgi:hypothetical protein
MALLDGRLEITDLEHFILGLVAGTPEQNERTKGEKEDTYQGERSHIDSVGKGRLRGLWFNLVVSISYEGTGWQRAESGRR